MVRPEFHGTLAHLRQRGFGGTQFVSKARDELAQDRVGHRLCIGVGDCRTGRPAGQALPPYTQEGQQHGIAQRRNGRRAVFVNALLQMGESCKDPECSATEQGFRVIRAGLRHDIEIGNAFLEIASVGRSLEFSHGSLTGLHRRRTGQNRKHECGGKRRAQVQERFRHDLPHAMPERTKR